MSLDLRAPDLHQDPPALRLPDSGVRLALLKGFELTNDGQPVPLPMTAQRLLAFLAVQDRPTRRPLVAGTLWPDTTEERANASLRTALWRLRACRLPVVQSGSAHLSLHPDLKVDLREIAPLIDSLLDHRVRCDRLELGELALAGDLLPDWYEDWLLIERERFRQLRLHALESLCDQLSSEGRFVLAIQAGLLAVSGEPLRESAHRALIRAYLAEGNRAEALRQYRLCKRILDGELGVEPSPQMEELISEPSAR
jgi:DNA-binding SARP family transcriptional activator